MSGAPPHHRRAPPPPSAAPPPTDGMQPAPARPPPSRPAPRPPSSTTTVSSPTSTTTRTTTVSSPTSTTVTTTSPTSTTVTTTSPTSTTVTTTTISSPTSTTTRTTTKSSSFQGLFDIASQMERALHDAASTMQQSVEPRAAPKRRAPPPPSPVQSASPAASSSGGDEDARVTDCLAALNRARQSPAEAIAELEAFRATFCEASEPRIRLDEWTKRRIMTNEGVAAVDEAIAFLRQQADAGQTLPALTLCPALSRACRDHLVDHNQAAMMGHAGSDGSTPSDRMLRYGRWLNTCGENIDYGNASGSASVLAWLVDDGVADRGHRINIFNPKFTVVGIAYGDHPTFGISCVLDFTGGFIPH